MYVFAPNPHQLPVWNRDKTTGTHFTVEDTFQKLLFLRRLVWMLVFFTVLLLVWLIAGLIGGLFDGLVDFMDDGLVAYCSTNSYSF